MQLTGNQIIERRIITKYDSEKAIQQQGVDVRVIKISRLVDYEIGVIGLDKTIKPNIYPEHLFTDEQGHQYWMLEPGYYELEFIEGCSIPNNACLNFRTRSSLVRCGAEVLSGQFDAGFHTDNMGAFLDVKRHIKIYKNARVAQAVVFETANVENLYNGQWQNDKQR